MLYDAQYFGSYGHRQPKIKTMAFVGFDTEDDTKGNPMSVAFYDGGRHLKNKYFYTTDMDQAIKFMIEYPEPAVFVAHNLAYDIGNIHKKTDFRYIDEKMEIPKMIKCTLLGTKNYCINSNAFFLGSLESMGKIIGIEKLKGNKRTQLNSDYVITDARITYEYMTQYQIQINNEGVNLGLTTGATAMNVYRAYHMINKKQVTYNNPEILRSYFGGRVELFYKGIIKGPVWVLDINSSYPNVMVKYEYPDTSTIESSSINTHKFGIGKFTVKVSENFIPILPFRSERKRLYFPKGKITGYWTYAEMNEALKQGAKIIKEHEGVGTNLGCRPYKTYVPAYYERRETTKKDIKKFEKSGNTVSLLSAVMESQKLKDFLNHRYGKDGQHKKLKVNSRRPVSINQLEMRLGEGYTEQRKGPFFEYRQEMEKSAITANFMWASHTTSYARLELHKHLSAIHKAGGTLIYCDTDSIMFTGDALNLDIGDKLGQLDFEYDKQTYKDKNQKYFDIGIFRQAKGYLLCNYTGIKKGKLKELEPVKSACKGVPTDYAYEFLIEGMAEFKKPMKMGEYFISSTAKKSKIKREIAINFWDKVRKKQLSIYVKRKGNSITYPVNADEIESLDNNSYLSEYESYESNLTDLKIIVKKKKKINHFENVKIPKNWYKNFPWELKSLKYYESQKDFLINKRELPYIEDGSIWFAGTVESIVRLKFGDAFALRLHQYWGQVLTSENILALFPTDYFRTLKTLKNDLAGVTITITKEDEDEIILDFHSNGIDIKNKMMDKKSEYMKKKEVDKRYKLINYLKKKREKALTK